MIAKSVISLALAGLAASQPLHGHHVHKREAAPEPVDVYITDMVTYYVTEGADTPAATGAVVNVADNVVSSVEAVPTSTSFVTIASATAASSSAAAIASSSSSVGSAGAMGITYSPYNADSSCKSADQVKSEMAQLSGYDIIRIYGVDCDQVSTVSSALGSNQKLFAGIYFMDQIESGLKSMYSQLGSDWSKIHTISIGNELVNDGEATTSEVSSYMSTARSVLSDLGYTGPVVAVDTFIAVIEHPELCDYSDYMGVNAHAFYDGTVTADQAGKWALEQIQRVWTSCGGKKSVMITESGWPSQGETNGVAVPSEDNLESAVSSLKNVIGNDVILFSSYNNLWESPGEFDCQQYWGIYGTASD